MKEEKVDNAYNANSIDVLTFPQACIQRPGMYIGGTSADGLHHVLWEIFDNSVDEALAGHCKKIVVTNEGDGWISVLDNGRGVPVDVNKKTGKPGIELVFCELHAGGKFHNDDEASAFSYSSGLHGVGASVTQALSEQMQVNVWRNGKVYQQCYAAGYKTCELSVVTEPCHAVLEQFKTGTYVRFRPSNKVFKHIKLEWEYDRIARRAREIAFLIPGLEIIVRGWGTDLCPDACFKFDNGLSDLVKHSLGAVTRLTDDFTVSVALPELKSEAAFAFAYETGYDEHLVTYVNTVPTHEGGVHREAFLSALLSVVITIGDQEKLLRGFEGKIKKSDVLEGLHGAVVVKVAQPEFEGQTKNKLGNPELRQPLEEAFTKGLEGLFKKRKDDVVKIATKVIDAVKARDAARKAKDLVHKKGAEALYRGKLADCESNDASVCEIYICEGDCFHPNTLIHTQGGLKRLGEIKNGDMVYTHNHRYRKATVLKPKIKRKKCRVTIQGRSFVCSADHLFLIMRCDDGTMEWVRAEELKTTDLVVKTCVLDDEKDRSLLSDYLLKLNIQSPSQKEIDNDRHQQEKNVIPVEVHESKK